MDTPQIYGTYTATPDRRAVDAGQTSAGQQGDASALGRLLPGLWLATAVGLVVVPFLTQYRVLTGYTDEAIQEGIPDVGQSGHSVNGWGQWDGLAGGHDPRAGILFAVVAGLLILAAVATIGWRRARWPVWLGLLASTMAATASVLQVVELEAKLYLGDLDDSTFRSDATVGLGAWLVPVLVVLSLIAVALSFAQIRRLRSRAPGRRTPEAPIAGRLSYVLPVLWLVAAIGLAVAPFLTTFEIGHDDYPGVIRVDGWGRTEGSLGVPCAILAAGLVVAAIAMTVRRTAILPLRIGLLAGTGAVVVGAFQLLRLESVLADENPPYTFSLGAGGWLVLAAGLLAGVTVVLTLIRQRSLDLRDCGMLAA